MEPPEALNPSDKLSPARMWEDQEEEPTPIVAGAPPYADPNDPDAAGNQMFEMEEGQFGGPSQEAEGGATSVPTTEEGEADEEALDEKTVVELKEMAKGLEVEGYSSMNKGELVDAVVEAHEESQQEPEEEEGEESA